MEWEHHTISSARMGLIMEEKTQKTRKQLARNLMLENQRLAAEQKKQLEYLDKEVYTNQPTDAYFSQFNTTTRWQNISTLYFAVGVLRFSSQAMYLQS